MAEVFQAERKRGFQVFTRKFMPENTIKHTTSQQFTEKPSQDVCNVPTRFSSSYFCALYTLEHTRFFDRQRAGTTRRRLAQLVSMLEALRRILWRRVR